MKYITYISLLIVLIGCNNTREYDPCLQALEVVSALEFENGEIEYEVVGKIVDFSKGDYELGMALEETLNLDKKILTGCLVFEENFPECFGFFILDSRMNLGIANIKFHEKAKVKLRRIKLKTPILETARKKQKNVEYLYLVKEVQNLH